MFRRNGYKVTVTGRLGLYMNYRDKYHFYRIHIHIGTWSTDRCVVYPGLFIRRFELEYDRA